VPETATARAAGLIVNFMDRFQTKGHVWPCRGEIDVHFLQSVTEGWSR